MSPEVERTCARATTLSQAEERLLPEERILIVDNDQSVLGMAADTLRALGYLVVAVESGQDAMSIVGRERFDLVMAGEALPDLDAAALIQRSRGVNPNTSAIIMTERHNAGIGFELTSVGSRLILAKPFDEVDLKATVSQALDKRDVSTEGLRL